MDFSVLKKEVDEAVLVDAHAPNDAKLVRIIWVDGSGQHRCRVRFIYYYTLFKFEFNFYLVSSFKMLDYVIIIQAVPFKRFNDVTKRNGIGLPFAVMAASSCNDCPAAGSNLSSVGEMSLMPDLSTKRTVPWYVAFNSSIM